ncbi:MAG: helix-turn-helix domain-containing protein [Lentisphaeraceae bacterium]|nr:helix-turn-helix domain-containing protein [Lentisphaeraceae bacterium]
MKKVDNRKELFEKVELTNLTFGEFVKASRKAVGRTQKEYAKAMSLEVKTLSLIENGKANITFQTAEKLLKPWGMELVVKKKKPE